MKKEKNKLSYLLPLIIIISAFVISLILYLVNSAQKSPYSREGVLTDILQSCGKTSLVDGKVIKDSYICDAGNAIIVDGNLKVLTGGGALNLNKEANHNNRDLEKARVGDRVRVDYEIDERGMARTTCQKCGISVLKETNLPQTN